MDWWCNAKRIDIEKYNADNHADNRTDSRTDNLTGGAELRYIVFVLFCVLLFFIF